MATEIRPSYAKLVASVFLIWLLTAIACPAQSIPGVYGGVPPKLSATITEAQLIGTTSSGTEINLVLPLNGVRNYVFAYNGSSLLPAGNYDVYYLNSSGTQIASASKNPIAYNGSNGVAADPPNPASVNGALGIQVTLLDQKNGNKPLAGATVRLLNDSGGIVASLVLNPQGFVSFYYTNSSHAAFIPPGTYQLFFQRPAGGDKYYYLDDVLTYNPTTTQGSNYYIQNAVANDGTISVGPQCLPDDPLCNYP